MLNPNSVACPRRCFVACPRPQFYPFLTFTLQSNYRETPLVAHRSHTMTPLCLRMPCSLCLKHLPLDKRSSIFFSYDKYLYLCSSYQEPIIEVYIIKTSSLTSRSLQSGGERRQDGVSTDKMPPMQSRNWEVWRAFPLIHSRSVSTVSYEGRSAAFGNVQPIT